MPLARCASAALTAALRSLGVSNRATPAFDTATLLNYNPTPHALGAFLQARECGYTAQALLSPLRQLVTRLPLFFHSAVKLSELTQPIVAVVHLAHQPPLVNHQVLLHPDKIVSYADKDGHMIRLGEFPGDEANGWIDLQAIEILHVLGSATYDPEKREVKVTPL